MAATLETDLSEAARLGAFLGLPRARALDDMSLVRRVRDGFPSRTADIVVRRIDPDGRFVKATDIIPKSTLHRRKGKAEAEGNLSKEESERILAVAKVLIETLRIYHDDKDKAVAFLLRAHPMLEGRSPIDLTIESIAGADLVSKLLLQLDAGVAA